MLHLLMSFVLVFEQKEPMVHHLHNELKETLRSFLACFLKIEKVKSISEKKMLQINVKEKDNQKTMTQWLRGKQVKSYLLYGLNKQL